MRILRLVCLLGLLIVIALYIYEAIEGNFQQSILPYKGTLFVTFLLGFLWSWKVSPRKPDENANDQKPAIKIVKTLIACYVLGGLIIFSVLVIAKMLTWPNAETFIQSNFPYLALPLALILMPLVFKRIK